MKVEIIKPISFCFGVKRAINLVERIRKEFPNNNIYLFGELVHNKMAMEPLINEGIKVVEFTKNNAETILNSFCEGDIVVFSAHGHNKKYENILKKNNVKFFDSTCPIVSLNLNKIEKSDRAIIFVGKSGHPETEASLSRNKNTYLYDIVNGIDYSEITEKEVVVLNQTTLSFLELSEIFEDIKNHFPNAVFTDEICTASRIRQENVMKLDDSFDLVLIIGDKKSSNTTKLFEISSKNKHHDTFFVSCLKDLNMIDLKKYNKVALFSGTSCPEELINQIKKKIEEF